VVPSAVTSTVLKYLFQKCCLAANMIAFVFHVDFCDVGFYNKNMMTCILLPEMEVKTFFFSEVLYIYFQKSMEFRGLVFSSKMQNKEQG